MHRPPAVANGRAYDGSPRRSLRALTRAFPARSRIRNSSTPSRAAKSRESGNLRIGDHWNAITIIALSQSNPLKAVAKLVENSIDAGVRSIVITRGKEKGSMVISPTSCVVEVGGTRALRAVARDRARRAIPQDQLLERLLELTLYTEENLR